MFFKVVLYIFQSSRSSETALGETGDPRELFLLDECDDNPLGAIIDKVQVSYYKLVLPLIIGHLF